MEIMLLGTRASGKTSFMDASKVMLSKGYRGYYTDELDFVRKIKVGKKLRKGEYRTTINTNQYSMSIQKGRIFRREAGAIKWVDYRGESIEFDEAYWIQDAMEESDGVILFIDANLYESSRMTALHYLDLLFGIVNKLEFNNPPLAIVLTKCDMIDMQPHDLLANIMEEVDQRLNIQLNFEIFTSSIKDRKNHPPAKPLIWLYREISR